MIEDLNNDGNEKQLKMTFIRFMNVKNEKKKKIGFSVDGGVN